ncbi:MAG: ATP-binding cassette domain-containing protein, partial [Candidatus Fimadaptatus sp.]
MLKIRGLTYQAHDGGARTDILNGVDLDVADGAFLVLTGPNGGGKTTLARAIMGLKQPTGGQILLDGVDITGMSVTERARLGVSYGFQQPPRFKGMRVRDLLELAAGREELDTQAC